MGCGFICTPLLHVAAVLSLSVCHFQIQIAVGIAELVCLCGIHDTAGVLYLCQLPLLGSVGEVDCPFHHVGSGTCGSRLYGNAALVAAGFGEQVIDTVCGFVEFEPLCIGIGGRPDAEIGAVCRSISGNVQQVGHLVTDLGIQGIIAVTV